MANGNFVVQNGLEVGPLVIDAATGSIQTSGNVTITGNLGVSQIAKNDSSIVINDAGTSSNVVITIDGATEHTITSDGVNLASGDWYAINSASVLTATTLGSGVVNSSLTSLGVITALSATTGVTTNFSTGNARITGGYADNFPIGANTKATGAFTALTATGNVDLQNTVYGRGVYDNSVRVVSTSTGIGNITVNSNGSAYLTQTGPGVATTGSATAIPVITTDAYGRISAISTAAVSSTLSIAGSSGTGTVSLTSQTLTVSGGTGVTTSASGQTVTVSIPQAVATSSTPTFAGLTINGTITATTLNAATIGNTSAAVIGATGRFDTSVTTATLNAATIGNASAALTGGTVNISGAGAVGTLVATTGLSTANAIFTSASTTTGVITNFSSGNARITGGYADNFPIGANTRATGAFTTLTSTGITQITDATNNSGASYASGALQVTGGAGIGGHLYVQGNLYVSNIVATSSQTLNVVEPLLYLTADNPGTYNYEVGVYSHFGLGATYQHTGVVRDHNDGVWKIFGNAPEPAGGTITFTSATYDAVKAGSLTLANTAGTVLSVGGNTAITSTLYTNGLYDSGNRAVSTSTGAGNLTISGAAINLPAAGPGAASVGSSTAIPVITTDAYGRISNTSTAAVIAPAGTLSGATLNSTVTASSLTSLGVVTALSATTAVATNFSTGNARITGGYADNFPIGANTKATGAFTTLTATGNVDLQNTVYGRGVYDNSVRVVSTSTGAGNLTISSGAINLPAAGPGAASVGSSTAIPVITTDAYGRISNTSTAAVIAPAGTLSGATLNSTVTASSLTSVGTLTGLTVSGAIVPNANASVNLGSTTAYWGNVITNGMMIGSGHILPNGNVSVNIGSTTQWFNTYYGVSTQAKYADLAENYQADNDYTTGTVLMFGGDAEVTIADAYTTRVAGVVSSNPAHLMNGGLTGPGVVPLALQGRVPCQVIGPVAKGDMMVSAGLGYAKASATPGIGQVIGKALEDFPAETKGIIEVVVGRV